MAVTEHLADLPWAQHLTPAELPLEPDGDHDGVHFDRVELDGSGGGRFIECAFTNSTLAAGRYRRSRLSDVWLADVRVVGADLAETAWVDATFLRSVVAGVQAFGSTWRRIAFQGCKLDSVNLREAHLTDVVFQDCLLRDPDLAGAKLTRVTFPGTRITGAVLDKATLTGCDLRGAELGIASGHAALKGTTIDTGQLFDLAPHLAQHLGITVT
ncbi:pentapeptide repeat-containing protein [Embleya sp. NBC_00896]|uniref:pentapeptide repeat-containing protein n=1 Tax=Embleya sp. NBC_00896 TaxID=2975961 RepID=UPI0038659003|nr:pentapeptide repeat-containing protein [Embleya sp. NBC_00896]